MTNCSNRQSVVRYHCHRLHHHALSWHVLRSWNMNMRAPELRRRRCSYGNRGCRGRYCLHCPERSETVVQCRFWRNSLWQLVTLGYRVYICHLFASFVYRVVGRSIVVIQVLNLMCAYRRSAIAAHLRNDSQDG